MTKIKNVGAKSWSKRKAGRSTTAPKSQPAPKRSQPAPKRWQNRQSGGQWSGGWNRNRDQWGLSYDASQQQSRSTITSDFSSFFAPSKSGSQQSSIVELGLLIRKHWVGGLIGKKGKTIWMIRDRSHGANIDFGNDDIVLDRSKDGKWQQSPWPVVEPEKYNICAISGSKQQASAAAKVIAELLAKTAQSPQYRLEFLIPEAYVGVFIGKKGTNLKKMREGDVSIEIRDEPILLGSNKTTLCTLFGSATSMLQTIERTAKWLGDISIRARTEKENE